MAQLLRQISLLRADDPGTAAGAALQASRRLREACSQREEFALPSRRTAISIDSALTPDECASLVRTSENVGYVAAMVGPAAGTFTLSLPDKRKCSRCVIVSEAAAAELWRRLEAFVPAQLGEWRAVGIHEELRFLRYGPADFFAAHTDGPMVRSVAERSFLSVIIYLSADVEGGETLFYDDFQPTADGAEEMSRATVRPQRGAALVFPHDARHAGGPVARGQKYALRTDVMYAQRTVEGSEERVDTGGSDRRSE